MKCRKCKNELEECATYCKHCGTPVNSDMPKALAARSAGWMWVVFGGLMILVGLLAVALTSDFVIFLTAIAMGLPFAYIGIRTIRGIAKDTIGNSLGSILIGAFGLYSSDDKTGGGALFIMLIVVGMLALIGRKSYLEWQNR
jgi:hypothetical protein